MAHPESPPKRQKCPCQRVALMALGVDASLREPSTAHARSACAARSTSMLHERERARCGVVRRRRARVGVLAGAPHRVRAGCGVGVGTPPTHAARTSLGCISRDASRSADPTRPCSIGRRSARVVGTGTLRRQGASVQSFGRFRSVVSLVVRWPDRPIPGRMDRERDHETRCAARAEHLKRRSRPGTPSRSKDVERGAHRWCTWQVDGARCAGALGAAMQRAGGGDPGQAGGHPLVGFAADFCLNFYVITAGPVAKILDIIDP